jgi:hypothetical protein
LYYLSQTYSDYATWQYVVSVYSVLYYYHIILYISQSIFIYFFNVFIVHNNLWIWNVVGNYLLLLLLWFFNLSNNSIANEIHHKKIRYCIKHFWMVLKKYIVYFFNTFVFYLHAYIKIFMSKSWTVFGFV